MMHGSALDPKKKAIEELMAHLDMKDGEELGEAMKPKGVGVEVTKVEGLGDEPSLDNQEVSPGMEGEESKPGMSEEELTELIEAIQSKLGA